MSKFFEALRSFQRASQVAALARAYFQERERMLAAREEWSRHLSDDAYWHRYRECERAVRDASLAFHGALSTEGKSVLAMRVENERLREQVSLLKRELRERQISAERRNKDLDALHLVWCNGGCGGGVHRYCGSPDDVTEEVVQLAEHHVQRLRTWFENRKYKKRST